MVPWHGCVVFLLKHGSVWVSERCHDSDVCRSSVGNAQMFDVFVYGKSHMLPISFIKTNCFLTEQPSFVRRGSIPQYMH